MAPRRLRFAHSSSITPTCSQLRPAASEHVSALLLATDEKLSLYPPSPTFVAPPLTPSNPICATALTPDAAIAIVAHSSGLVSFHSILEQRPSSTITPFRDERVVSFIAVDPSAHFVALASSDGLLHVYAVENRSLTHVLNVASMITTLIFAPNSRSLYVGAEDGSVSVFELNSKSRKPALVLSPHVARINSIAFSDHRLVSVSQDNVLAITDISHHNTKPTLLRVDDSLVDIIALDDYALTVGEKGIIRVWNTKTAQELRQSSLQLPFVTQDEEDPITVTSMRLMSKRKIAIALSDQTLLFVHADNVDRLTVSSDIVCANLEEIYDVRALDSTTLAVASNSNAVHILKYEDEQWRCEARLQQHSGIVLSLDVLQGQKALQQDVADAYLATSARDNNIRVWRRVNCKWQCFALGEGHMDAVGAVAFSPRTTHGQFFVVSGASDRTIKLWSLDSAKRAADKAGEPKHQLAFEASYAETSLSAKWTVLAHDKDINAVAVSPDGRIIASGSQDRSVKLWDAANGSLSRNCVGHRRGVWAIQFSSVDRILASCSGDSTVRLWNVADGSCLRNLQGHLAGVLKANFISSGTQLATVGADGLLKVWNVRNDECCATLDGHEDRVWALSNVDDGDKLITGGADGLIQVWGDVTKETIDAEMKKKGEEELMKQTVLNAARARRWETAARGALQLGMSQKLKSIFSELVITVDDPDAELIKVVKGLAEEEGEGQWSLVRKLLLCCRDWNASGGSKSAAVAAYVMKAVFSCWTSDTLCDAFGSDGRAIIEALAAHVDRHEERIGRVVTKLGLLEFTLNCMRGLPEPETQRKALDRKNSEKNEALGSNIPTSMRKRKARDVFPVEY
ncbi:WD40-repeat containing protein [Gracilaria domingensis]|nr:WD40-repeat containing protein [Gracilaria domingensis]